MSLKPAKITNKLTLLGFLLMVLQSSLVAEDAKIADKTRHRLNPFHAENTSAIFHDTRLSSFLKKGTMSAISEVRCSLIRRILTS